MLRFAEDIMATYIIDTFNSAWCQNLDIKILEIEGWISGAHKFFVCFDNLLDIHIDKIIKEISVLFHNPFCLEELRN